MIQSKRLKILFNKTHAVLTGSVFFTSLIIGNEIFIDPMSKLFFFIVIIGMILTVTALITFWADDLQLKPNILDLLVGIYYVLCTTSLLRNGISFYNEKFLGLTSLILLYGSLRIAHQVVPREFFSTRKLIVFMMLMGSALIQSIWGLLQFYGVMDSQNVTFQITGAFTNPAPYALYLAACTPITLGIYLHFKSGNKNEQLLRYLAGTTLVLELLSLSATQNRASWIASSLGIFLVFVKEFHLAQRVRSVISNRARWIVFILVLPIFAVALSFGLYLLKPDSAYGRVLRWRVSYQMLNHDHLWGHGYSLFPKVYNNAQSSWFSQTPRDTNDIMISGDQRYAYNDYLETAVELGIPSLLVLLLIIITALRRLIFDKAETYGNPSFLYGISLVGICVMSLFSYPLSSLPTQIIFFFLISQPVQRRSAVETEKLITYHPILNRIAMLAAILAIVGIVIVFMFRYYEIYRSTKNWQYAKYYQQLGRRSESARIFGILYPVLKFNGEFLKDYGICLYLNGEYHKSIDQLKRASHTISDPQLYIALGESYQKLNALKDAAKYYSVASNMVPGRLFPKYKLAVVSLKMNNYQLACRLAREIVVMQIKVPSPAARQIKEEMRVILLANCK